jgi:hypothetical protein
MIKMTEQNLEKRMGFFRKLRDGAAERIGNAAPFLVLGAAELLKPEYERLLESLPAEKREKAEKLGAVAFTTLFAYGGVNDLVDYMQSKIKREQ